MKKNVRKILRWIINICNIPSIIDEVREDHRLKQINSVLTNNGAFFYAETKIANPQDPSKIIINSGSHIRGQLLLFGYAGKINIGQNCYIGEGTRIWSANEVTIGNNVLISHNVNIMDTNSHELDAVERSISYKNLVENGPWYDEKNIVTAPIQIGDYAWINFNSVILKGVTIGEGAIIGANSVITKDVEAYTFVAGNPAKLIRKL